MAYTISQLKTDLTGVLHGTNLNKIEGIDALIDRGARQLLLDIDPQETKRTVQLPQLFDDVYEYAIPDDLKGSKVIDIFPQNMKRGLNENVNQRYGRMFDLFKGRQQGEIMFDVEHNTGVKYIRIDNPVLPQGLTINSLSSITDNGTWGVGTDAVNLTVDTTVTAQTNTAVLRFDLDGSTTNGLIQNAMTNSVDMSDHANISSIFQWVYFPNASQVTSVKLDWGTDAANHWTRTVAVDAIGNAFSNFWNQLQFDWNGATLVGAPVASAISYLRLTINYDGTANQGYRAGAIISRIAEPFEIKYYSKYLFRDGATGAFQETVTDDTNLVNLDTESYNLLFTKCAEYAFQQQHDYGIKPGQSESEIWRLKYKENLRQYKRQYKSEVVTPRQAYYRVSRGRNDDFNFNNPING